MDTRRELRRLQAQPTNQHRRRSDMMESLTAMKKYSMVEQALITEIAAELMDSNHLLHMSDAILNAIASDRFRQFVAERQ